MIHRHLRFAVVGEPNVGKSMLIRCLARVGKQAEEENETNDGGAPSPVDKETIEYRVDATFSSILAITNTSGKEESEHLRKEAMSQVEGVIACFSVDNPASLDALTKKWIPEARAMTHAEIPVLIICTKSDLRDADPQTHNASTLVDPKHVATVAKKLKAIGHHEVSAQRGNGIDDAMQELLRAASIYKVKKDSEAQRYSSGSSTSSPKPRTSFLSRMLNGRASIKHRLSQRLLEVASHGETKEALDLLSKGAIASWSSVETKTTPLHSAARSGNVDVLNVLLYAKADVELRDSNGATALHVSCSNGHFQCAKALLDRSANPNAKNLVGATPLHEAAARGVASIVKLLIERGADQTLRDLAGRTPKDKAVLAGYPNLFDDNNISVDSAPSENIRALTEHTSIEAKEAS